MACQDKCEQHKGKGFSFTREIWPNPVLQPTAFGGGTRGFTGLSVVLVFMAFLAGIGGG